jgi:hypothetical protein
MVWDRGRARAETAAALRTDLGETHGGQSFPILLFRSRAVQRSVVVVLSGSYLGRLISRFPRR